MTCEPERRIDDLCRDFPETLPVLARYGIDLCCGGRLTLEEATRRHGIELEALLADLTQAMEAA